jgi:hypothetical protein
MTAYGQIMLTLVFMMMGIELRREQRREHLDDMIAVYSKGAGGVPWGQVLAIGFLDLLVTLLIMAGCFIRMAMDGAPALWIGQTLAYVALLYFLPCWILGVWGLLIAQWMKGKGVYLPAMLVWLLTSTLCAEFNDYTTVMGLGRADLFLSMVNMGINNFHIPGNFAAGAPIELPRWIVRIGILALLAALFLCDHARSLASTRPQKRRRWIAMASVIGCGVALLIFSYQRYSVFFARFADPGAVEDYVWSKHVAYIPGEPVSLADFPTEKRITLVKTDIDLSCTTQGMKAEVTMEAAVDAEASGQAFTLYSDLVVDEVLVDGEKADFQRSHDGLMVRFPSAKRAGDKVTFVFHYHGYSLPNYPANETTVQLNRSFPWIPWPGIKTATIYGSFYDYSESEDFFIGDWQRGDEVEYTLRYKGPGDLYTNLEGQGGNLYKGASSNGVSLYSGMVRYRYREVDVYVPASQYQDAYIAVDALLDAYDPLLDLCERMDTIRRPEKPRSIVFTQIRYPGISRLTTPQEPYSWNDEWEIRLQSDASTTVSTRKKFANSLEEYQTSTDVTAEMTVAYLLNPCTGYPVDASHASTRNYAAWLSVYIRASGLDARDLEYYKDTLRDDYSGKMIEYINGKIAPQTPLTQEEENWLGEILDRMHAGENFDEPFKALYHRLLRGERITASDIVSQLYYHKGA